MKLFSLLLTLFILMVFIFSNVSCTYEKEEDLSRLACDTTNVRFSVEIKNILDANCEKCHNASNRSGNLNVYDYNELKKSALTGCLVSSVKQNDPDKCLPMPSDYKLSSCKIQQLENWVKEGAPNN
jgi:hypothetical protein